MNSPFSANTLSIFQPDALQSLIANLISFLSSLVLSYSLSTTLSFPPTIQGFTVSHSFFITLTAGDETLSLLAMFLLFQVAIMQKNFNLGLNHYVSSFSLLVNALYYFLN